jgi:hypothetical protein
MAKGDKPKGQGDGKNGRRNGRARGIGRGKYVPRPGTLSTGRRGTNGKAKGKYRKGGEGKGKNDKK